MGKHYFQNLKPAHEELIVRRLTEEWEQAEKSFKKHELILKAKRAGLKMGKMLLTAGLVAGALTIVAVAPAVFVVFGEGPGRRFVSTSKVGNELSNGSGKKYWRYKKTGANSYRIELTKRGREVAMHNELRNFQLSVRPTWDGRWRIVMFDISKKNSTLRDALRHKLHEMGMFPLQESVFVYPYPCKEEVELWVDLFGISKGVEIAEVNFLPDRDKELRRIFNLPTL